MAALESLIGFAWSLAPKLLYFAIFMQLVHWAVLWAFSVRTKVNASDESKKSNNVIIMGAGFSGIGLGVLLKVAGVSFTILEKAEHLGGTWWYNDYPGAAVDVKSHTYCFSFYQKRLWKDTYSMRDEILQYIRDVADHFQLKAHIRYKTKVKCGEWDEKARQWVIETTNGEIFRGRFMVNCCGFLHKPKIPKINGMDKFKGRMFHAAQWQHDFDYTGKKAAVVGSGCSAIQIVPELAKTCKEVHMFQKTPSIIVEKPGDEPYSATLRAISFVFPWTQWINRIFSYGLYEVFYIAWNDNFFGRAVRNKIWHDARSQIKSQEFADQILFKQDEINGCKRPAQYTQFYRKFEESDACRLHCEAVTEITEKGIRLKNGDELEVDFIVLATGYDMMHYKDVPMTAHGKNFDDFWSTVPYSFNGVLHSNFPNYFMMLGPQTGSIHGAGSVYYSEMQGELIMNIIRTFIERDSKTVCLKESMYRKWIKDYDHQINTNKSWLLTCDSWYSHNGKPWQPYAWPSYKLMADCKWPKYDEWFDFTN